MYWSFIKTGCRVVIVIDIMFFCLLSAKIANETDSSDKTEDGAEIDEVQQSWWHRKRWVPIELQGQESFK